jgi:hypothetical protein
VATEQRIIGGQYNNLSGFETGKHAVIYIFGKITYNDIFGGTKLHTTKYCLMRAAGDHFTSCSTGNSMD